MGIKSEALFYVQISRPATTGSARYKFVQEYLMEKEQEYTDL